MNIFYANQTVVYKDEQGNLIDTFVLFDTDPETGFTHINHQNLKVRANELTLHGKTVGRYHMPLEDAFSFEIFNKLREKHGKPQQNALYREMQVAPPVVMAQAS
jgi:hypothetical protein